MPSHILCPRFFLLCFVLKWRWGIAWRSEGTLPSEQQAFAIYVGKFCFDYVEDQWSGGDMSNDTSDSSEDDNDPDASKVPPAAVAGYFDITVNGSIVPALNAGHAAEQKAEARAYSSGPPCWGSCNSTGKIWLMAFSDQRHRWQQVRWRWDELSCEERKALSSYSWDISESLGGLNATRRHVTVRQRIRPRFWYFAFVNCGANISSSLQFGIHSVNIHQGYQAEFSLDQRGSLPLEASFALLFTLLALCGRGGSGGGKVVAGRRARRPLLRLLQASACLSAIGCFLRAVHHTAFAYDGRGVALCGVLGTLYACAARALLTIIQFLIAKGWAILFTPHERCQLCLILSVLFGVIGLSVGGEVHEHYFHDTSTNFYLYESWPGLLILLLNILLLGTSWRLTWITYRQETMPEIRAFYRVVSAAGGIYFASLPVICLVAGLLSPWVVRKYVERGEISSRFIATALMLWALRPSRIDGLVAMRLKNREQPELLEEEMREADAEDGEMASLS